MNDRKEQHVITYGSAAALAVLVYLLALPLATVPLWLRLGDEPSPTPWLTVACSVTAPLVVLVLGVAVAGHEHRARPLLLAALLALVSAFPGFWR